MKDYKLEKIDFKLESISTEDKKFYFVGKALSKDFECETGLERLKSDVLRAPFVWRHSHPMQKENKETHIYGRIVKSWVDEKNEHLYVKGEVYNHTTDHLALIDLMQKRAKVGDPLSLSMHYRTYENELGVKIHYDVFEISGTPFPACKTCKTIKNFKLEENIMTEDKIDETVENVDETKTEDETIVEALEKIKELEEQLNSKTHTLEEINVKVAKLEEDITIKDKELEDKEEVAKTLEDRVLELEQKADFLEKKPFLDRIADAKKIDDRELEFYKNQDIKYLEAKAVEAEKEAESKVVTKTLEETAEDATADDSEADVEDKVSFDKFVSHLGLETKKISD